jgi:hypothetical protein
MANESASMFGPEYCAMLYSEQERDMIPCAWKGCEFCQLAMDIHPVIHGPKLELLSFKGSAFFIEHTYRRAS